MSQSIVESIDTSELSEIGELGTWMLTSSKPAHGSFQLRDNNLETYWQSDGLTPHTLSVEFSERVVLSHVAIYLDYEKDESYTPSHFELLLGTGWYDTESVFNASLTEPVGWVVIDLTSEDDMKISDESENQRTKGIGCHILKLIVSKMHQNGRDTHIRQIKLFSKMNLGLYHEHDAFTTDEMNQYHSVR